MIVGPLKSNVQAAIIILLLLCIGAWLGTFSYIHISTEQINYKEHILYSFFFRAGFSFIVNQIITLIVVLLGALFVNFLVIEQEITSKTNYLPAFFYILFSFSATTKSAVLDTTASNTPNQPLSSSETVVPPQERPMTVVFFMALIVAGVYVYQKRKEHLERSGYIPIGDPTINLMRTSTSSRSLATYH